jgi:hypothetical protein
MLLRVAMAQYPIDRDCAEIVASDLFDWHFALHARLSAQRRDPASAPGLRPIEVGERVERNRLNVPNCRSASRRKPPGLRSEARDASFFTLSKRRTPASFRAQDRAIDDFTLKVSSAQHTSYIT